VLWLGLDGALGAFSAALAADDDPLWERTASASGNDALERGIAVIDEVLGERSLASLGGIAVGVGPGSFTGLRVALSYAKSLAFAANLPLVGISSYDALTPFDAAATSATFVHGRSGVACVRLRTPSGEFTTCGDYAALARELAARLPRGELVSYGAAEGVAPALGERGIIVRPIVLEDVPALRIVRRAMRTPASGSGHAVRADYGEAHYAERDPETRRPG
jgi:tRNA threonylcarbamoyladenosine biosynthesis protein TsaB